MDPSPLSRNPSAALLVVAGELAALSEQHLQDCFIEPLFRALGYLNIRSKAGPTERGKDLIANKVDEFNRTTLVAIQIKKFKASAKSASTKSFGHLLNQLDQASDEAVVDPATGVERAPDTTIFVTPYPIPPEAMEAFKARTRRVVAKGVVVIDGPLLVDLLERYLPDSLSRLSMQTQYRLRMADELWRIRESRVAFQLSDELDMREVFVDIGVDDTDPRLHEQLTFQLRRRVKKLLGARSDATVLLALQDQLDGEALTLTGARGSPLVTIDIEPFLVLLNRRLRRYYEQLRRLGDDDVTPTECNAILDDGLFLRSILLRALTLEMLTLSGDSAGHGVNSGEPLDEFAGTLDTSPLTESRVAMTDAKWSATPRMRASTLAKIQRSTFVYGGPGAGKTTLLRMLARRVVRDDLSSLPVFVRLATVTTATYPTLFAAIRSSLAEFGYEISDRDLQIRLDSAEVHLFLDGLDEAGSNAPSLMQAIQTFAARHQRCRIVVSCRDTAGIRNYPSMFAVHLRPFDDGQLDEFVRNWFRHSEPAEGLLKWLSANEHMRDTAKTPLIAGLLCSLYQTPTDLPTTELELYERRFELLLGKWDQAKRLPPLSPHRRKRYLMFLEDLAFALQCREQRAAPMDDVVALARRHLIDGFHRSAADLVTDCIRRGVIERDFSDHCAFGHLTYQEYLASEYLSKTAATPFVWGRLRQAWWTNTITYYVTRRMDVSSLLRMALTFRPDVEVNYTLRRLSTLAPLTSQDLLKRVLQRPLEDEGLAEYDWNAPAPALAD